MGVIYTGIRQIPENTGGTALEEDVLWVVLFENKVVRFCSVWV